MFDITTNQADSPRCRFLFAHGAGAGKDSEFMAQMAALLAERHIEVVRFDFPYMQTIATTGKRRPPDKADKLQAYFHQVIAHVKQTMPALPLFIGGKSMGGRMATLIADEADVNGTVVFGYPFHPPGKPDKLRTEHLAVCRHPVHIIQGERDTFGRKDEISAYTLSDKLTLTFLADGDHSLKPRKSSGFDYASHMQQAADTAAAFMQEQGA